MAQAGRLTGEGTNKHTNRRTDIATYRINYQTVRLREMCQREFFVGLRQKHTF